MGQILLREELQIPEVGTYSALHSLHSRPSPPGHVPVQPGLMVERKCGKGKAATSPWQSAWCTTLTTQQRLALPVRRSSGLHMPTYLVENEKGPFPSIFSSPKPILKLVTRKFSNSSPGPVYQVPLAMGNQERGRMSQCRAWKAPMAKDS